MLGDVEWKTEMLDDIDDTGMGRTHTALARIRLAEKTLSGQMSKNVIHNTFIHELVHAILDNVGRPDLSDNEAFVEPFANFLKQALATMKYRDVKN